MITVAFRDKIVKVAKRLLEQQYDIREVFDCRKDNKSDKFIDLLADNLKRETTDIHVVFSVQTPWFVPRHVWQNKQPFDVVTVYISRGEYIAERCPWNPQDGVSFRDAKEVGRIAFEKLPADLRPTDEELETGVRVHWGPTRSNRPPKPRKVSPPPPPCPAYRAPIQYTARTSPPPPPKPRGMSGRKKPERV